MNEENDKRLDDLFKKKLEDPVDKTRYEEGDWTALEQMLDKQKKRKGIIYLLPILSSVAALLLLFLGWWAFHPKPENHHSGNQLQATNHHKLVNPVTNGGASKQPGVPKQNIPLSKNYAANRKNGKSTSKSKPFFTLSAAGSRRSTGFKEVNTNTQSIANTRADENLVAVNETPVITENQISAPDFSAMKVPSVPLGSVGNTAAGPSKIKTKHSMAYRPQYALTVLAAPDINGVGSFNQGKVGTNIGMQFAAGVTRKLTVSTGVLYSVKPYNTPFANYHTPYQFAVNPINVTADCRMLDIPLNVGYQIYNKQQNRFSIGTGLSSYIMLHENFKFNYEYAGTSGPSSFTVPNSSSYFLGVLNLNATYERQISSNVALSFQPYLKLPLTNIGYSQVRLQTTGIAVGLTWNLNSLTKP